MPDTTPATWPDVIDLQDELHSKARQLRALLCQTYGGPTGSEFRSASDDIQEDYLSACADIADGILEGLKELAERLREQRK